MWLTLVFEVFILFTGTYATPPADLLCGYEGKQYKHADMIPHANGCTLLQCQFGQVIAFWEACGKEIDGDCHAAGFSFLYDNIEYECEKAVIDGEPVYSYVRLTPEYDDCTAEGKVYKNLEKFRLSDTCSLYQCQDGNVQVVEPFCGKEIDGSCHENGTWYLFNDKYYECDEIEDQNGDLVYENKVMDPQPDDNLVCNWGGGQYRILDTVSPGEWCNWKQCQNGLMIEYHKMCRFFKDKGQCYRENEQWMFDNKLYECRRTTVDGKERIRPETDAEFYLGCYLGEDEYQHLDIIEYDEGCSLRQCVNGTVPYLKNTCRVNGQCMTLNSIFTSDGRTYKCIMTSYNYRKIVEVNEDGTFDEGEEPQQPEIGEIPPYEGCPAVADIVLVIDSSRSLSLLNYKLIIDFAINVTRFFKIGPKDVQFGAVVFSDDAQKVFDLNEHGDADSVGQALEALPYLQAHTRTDLALDMVSDLDMFGAAAGGRVDADDIVIVLTDGNSDDTDLTRAAADRLKAKGITIISVGVGIFVDFDELVAIASRYENAFLALSFEVLANILNAVSRRACDTVDKCKDDPCDHFCDGTETGYTCSCREGFEVDPNDSSKCKDIDECVKRPCQHFCENTAGSFECGCEEGYLVSLVDKTKCYDIDECTSGDLNPCQQVCKNLPGTYECSCEEGFKVDPYDASKCMGIDECIAALLKLKPA